MDIVLYRKYLVASLSWPLGFNDCILTALELQSLGLGSLPFLCMVIAYKLQAK